MRKTAINTVETKIYNDRKSGFFKSFFCVTLQFRETAVLSFK